MTWIASGLTAAEIAAMSAAGATAAGTAAAGTAAAAGGLGAAGAGGLTAAELAAAETAPLLVEGASAAPAMGLDEAFMPLDAMHGGAEPAAGGMDPMSSFRNLSEGNLTKEVTAPMQELGNSVPSITDSFKNIGEGNIGPELGNAMKSPSPPGMPGGDAMNPMSLFGGGGEAAPALPPDLPSEVPQTLGAASPSTPGTPMSLKEKFQVANMALRLGSKLVTNKKDKQTMGLLSMSTALGASGGDLSSPENMKLLEGPLEDISAGVQEPTPAPRLNQTLAPMDAPSTRAPTPGPARGMGTLPPTRLTSDAPVGFGDPTIKKFNMLDLPNGRTIQMPVPMPVRDRFRR